VVVRPRQAKDRDPGLAEGHDPDRQDWSRLGRLVGERRTDLGLTQAEVHSAGGPSPATLYLLEAGRRGSYRPQILRRLERALGWRAGSIRRVLAGGQPLLDAEDEIVSPIGADRASLPDGHGWVASFRQLPLSHHDKLLILSRLLEEVIAELGAGADDEPPGPNRVSRP
jgi:transcriptional regulator with XRE-family HTH domain